MFVVLNPHFSPSILLDILFPTAKCVQREVAAKWVHVSPNISVGSSSNDEPYFVHIDLFGAVDNIQELFEWTNIRADTPISFIIQMYLKYGIEQLARMLEGNYTLMILDYNVNRPCSVFYVLQNHLETRPLYTGVIPHTSNASQRNSLFALPSGMCDTYLFSENKEYLETVREKCPNMVIQPVSGGTYMEYHLVFGASPKWKYHSQHTYYTLPISPFLTHKTDIESRSGVDTTPLYGLFYDTLYQWLKRWLCQRYERNQSCIIVDTGDMESALIISICRQISVSLNMTASIPTVYRVAFEHPVERMPEHTIVVSPEELKATVDQLCETKTVGDIRKWIFPYFVAKHLEILNGSICYMLCSSFSDLFRWEKQKYTDLVEMEIANFKLLQTILPEYIQKRDETIKQVNPNIECISPIFQRSLVDILCRISAKTRVQWAEDGNSWIHELWNKARENTHSTCDHVPDEQWNAWERWWNNYEKEKEQSNQSNPKNGLYEIRKM